MNYLKFGLLFLFAIVFACSLWIDSMFAIYVSWFFLFSMITILVGLLAWIIKTNWPGTKLTIIVLSALLIFSVRYWDYNSLKPFLRTFNNLKKGMTKDEVLFHLRDYKLAGQGNGFAFSSENEAEPDLDNKVEFLNFKHTEEGWGDSDWGLAYFIDGKLYKTAFSPD